MAKGRKTKRVGRGKTKTPKASKASKAPKRSKYSRKKRKISRKRSLKGGMQPEFGRTLPGGPIVDEFWVRAGDGGTTKWNYNPLSNEPAIVFSPGPIPTPPPATRRLTAAELAQLRTNFAAQRRVAEAETEAMQEQRRPRSLGYTSLLRSKYDRSGRSAAQRRVAEAEAKAMQEQSTRERWGEVGDVVNDLIQAIEEDDKYRMGVKPHPEEFYAQGELLPWRRG